MAARKRRRLEHELSIEAAFIQMDAHARKAEIPTGERVLGLVGCLFDGEDKLGVKRQLIARNRPSELCFFLRSQDGLKEPFFERSRFFRVRTKREKVV